MIVNINKKQVGDKIGNYHLIRELGRGGFGEVWLAEKKSTIISTKFALKIARNDRIDFQSIQQEAILWAKASGHPNVLPIIEADEYNGQIIIVSEYVSGGSLKDWLIQNGGKAPSQKDAIEIITGLLSGLSYLHRKKIIHRDLKPANILLQDGNPRIADFGISELEKNSSNNYDFIVGTPEYMPPEVCRGELISFQSDIWAVGVIFYELLTGRKPFEDTDQTRLVAKICSNFPSPLPYEVSLLCEKVIQKALEKSPKDRFTSAEQMLDWLKGYSDKEKNEIPSVSNEIEISEEETIVRKKMDFAELRYIRGLNFFVRRNYKRAIADLSEAINLRPEPKFYQARALLYRRLGKDDLAREDEEKGGSIRNSNEDFYSVLFRLLKRYPL